MKTKEQVIKESWGSHYDIVKNKLDEFGWCQDTGNELFDKHKIYDNDENFDFQFWGVWDSCEVQKYRPISLRGINDNNGWVKLDDLNTIDKVTGYDCSIYKLHLWTNGGYYEYKDYLKWQKHYNNLIITHYKLELIEDIKPPIY